MEPVELVTMKCAVYRSYGGRASIVDYVGRSGLEANRAHGAQTLRSRLE